uniref:Single-strand binding protein n=1 Tax=Theileria parva TaxID=5875 RepID=Q4N402_THEPA|eukprot:XP_765404.1 hypothetical protein [Theileria parva strain Muguga]
MIFVFLFYNFCCCFALRTSPHSRKLFFINSSPPLQFNNRIQKLYEYDESFNDLVDNYESQEDSQHYQEGSFQQKEVPRDHFDLSANSVTLCGRIGFIAEPTVFPSGFRALKLSIATSDREKDGIVKTQWHRVILYGNRNVDYVYSRARQLFTNKNYPIIIY